MGLKANRMRWGDALSRVDPTRFESLLADYYRRQGYRVEHVGAEASGNRYDGGIDLKLYRDGRYVIVQCKRWNVQVPHNEVHQLIGIMFTQAAQGAILVTSGEYTRAAREAAAKHPAIELIDGNQVRAMLGPNAIEEPIAANDWIRDVGDLAFRRVPSTIRKVQRIWFLSKAIGFGLAALFVAIALISLPSVLRKAFPQRSTATQSTAQTSPQRVAANAFESMSTSITRAARMPDTRRPIDREAARQAVRPIPGVRSAIWLDRTNFVVMVDGANLRNTRMIDTVCLALEPLGDTLAVVVNLQDVTATTRDGAHTLSRNCQLAEGQRAFMQPNREVDVVSRELRERFKGMQEKTRN